MERLIEGAKERPMGLNYHRKWERRKFHIAGKGCKLRNVERSFQRRRTVSHVDTGQVLVRLSGK